MMSLTHLTIAITVKRTSSLGYCDSADKKANRKGLRVLEGLPVAPYGLI